MHRRVAGAADLTDYDLEVCAGGGCRSRFGRRNPDYVPQTIFQHVKTLRSRAKADVRIVNEAECR
jgi:hypothetical protein